MRRLSVVEIFYSLQGEGANMGKPAVFIRLAGCNLNCSFCDTEWKNGTEMSVEEILLEVRKYPSKMLIWTGGEPTLQLDDDVLASFSDFYNCIETNGTNPVPKGMDYIACSPKVSCKILQKNFVFVNEFRFPVQKNDVLPAISELPKAENYIVSPIFSKKIKGGIDKKNAENLTFCIDFVKRNPEWRLSFQSHKLLEIE
ncbi:MAG: 7-carboxy-7-deazaguanine synthase QueE [Prevotellaceae bacterium]|jgi:organic radical activating enzyme|nr:7-carboxy-7-deazaguanine synthase QueE [Prevotellaceae bacterium]